MHWNINLDLKHILILNQHHDGKRSNLNIQVMHFANITYINFIIIIKTLHHTCFSSESISKFQSFYMKGTINKVTEQLIMEHK